MPGVVETSKHRYYDQIWLGGLLARCSVRRVVGLRKATSQAPAAKLDGAVEMGPRDRTRPKLFFDFDTCGTRYGGGRILGAWCLTTYLFVDSQHR